MIEAIRRSRVMPNRLFQPRKFKETSQLYRLFRAIREKDRRIAWLRGSHGSLSNTLRINYSRYFMRHRVQQLCQTLAIVCGYIGKRTHLWRVVSGLENRGFGEFNGSRPLRSHRVHWRNERKPPSWTAFTWRFPLVRKTLSCSRHFSNLSI